MIEVICGPMFSGKSEELSRRIRRMEIGGLPYLVFKHGLDDRYGDGVTTHDGRSTECQIVDSLAGVSPGLETVTVFVDEWQFFSAPDMDKVIAWSRCGHRIVLAGLDMDWRGNPFPVTAMALAVAETVTKLTAVCTRCGLDATHSQKVAGGRETVEVGGHEAYEARCPAHFVPK